VRQDMIERIQELKRQRKAVILAHNYQLPEVQDIADYTGDSLGLSRQAAATEAEVIVFCGVHFMAETAAILCPTKTVLLPDLQSGCPMADMLTAEQLRAFKAEHPGAAVVCYVNSTAEVKAECDCCCTSANAVQVVQSFPADREILFVPDQYLGDHVMQRTGRTLVLWPGYCPTHARILDTQIRRMREEHPGAVVLAHPECPRPVRAAADQVLSTGGMSKFVRESPVTEFVIATEVGMLHRLRKDNPGKVFHPVNDMTVCPNMKRIRIEHILWSLERLQFVIRVPEEIRVKAFLAIERMLKISAG